MIHLKKLLTALLISGVLVACSEETPNRPDPELPPDRPTEPTQIDILNTPLPIHETFNVTGPADNTTGTGGGYDFFNPTYAALATPASNLILDQNDIPFTLTDTLPSLYYPTCCLFNTFPTDPSDPDYDVDLVGQQRRPPLETPASYDDGLDYRLKVADNKMAISNARFTIGQILSDLTTPTAVDRKVNTSAGIAGVSVTLGGWGELDLSEPYRISFCLADNGAVNGGGGGSGNTEVYVDNNSGGNQADSFHAELSMLLRTATTPLTPGNRMVIEVPGTARLVNNSGNQVGNILASKSSLIGTHRSFFQLRVSSGTYVVIRDLVIEYQSDRTVSQLVTDLPCTTDTAFWIDPPPTNVALNPADSQLGVAWNLYAGATGFEVYHNIVDSLSGATLVDVPSGTSTGITITGLNNDTTYYVFVRAKLGAEFSGYSSSVSAEVNPPPVPPNTPTGLMVAPLNGQAGVVWDTTATATAYDVAYNTSNTTSGATVIADITGLTTSIPSLANGTTYYVFVRAKNVVGPSAYSAGKAVIPTAPAASFWTGANLDLLGAAGGVPTGTLTLNTSSNVTFDLAGGNVSNSSHRLFFAYRQLTGDFKLVARLDSVTVPSTPTPTFNNNAYLFGLLMMENINTAASYGALARYAGTGYFLASATTFTGTTNTKFDAAATVRSRVDAAQAQGHLLRLSRTGNDVDMSYSTDSGVTWNSIRTGTFTGSPVIPDTWYVGVYGTHHINNGTGTYVYDGFQIYQ